MVNATSLAHTPSKPEDGLDDLFDLCNGDRLAGTVRSFFAIVGARRVSQRAGEELRDAEISP